MNGCLLLLAYLNDTFYLTAYETVRGAQLRLNESAYIETLPMKLSNYLQVMGGLISDGRSISRIKINFLLWTVNPKNFLKKFRKHSSKDSSHIIPSAFRKDFPQITNMVTGFVDFTTILST